MSAELVMADIGIFIFFVLLGIASFVLVMSLFIPRKSQEYRKTLMDMYVAAKIKFLAEKDGLDIAEEFESFKRWKKKQNLHDCDLDIVIEREIKENVAEPIKEKEKPKK